MQYTKTCIPIYVVYIYYIYYYHMFFIIILSVYVHTCLHASGRRV